MYVTFKSDWLLTPLDMAWLESYTRTKFSEVIPYINEMLDDIHQPNMTARGWDWDTLNLHLEIYLHSGVFISPRGTVVAGLYSPNVHIFPREENPYDYWSPKGFALTGIDLYDRIEISWEEETRPEPVGGYVLRHEMAHLLCRHSLLPNASYFPHGDRDVPISDPYLAMINRKIRRLYRPAGHEWPGELPVPR